MNLLANAKERGAAALWESPNELPRGGAYALGSSGTCPRCGADRRRGHRYCSRCGIDLHSEQPKLGVEPRSEPYLWCGHRADRATIEHRDARGRILRCLSCGLRTRIALLLQIGVDPVGAGPAHPLADQVVTLDRRVLIGREVGAEHVRVDDPYVSRYHAEIVWVWSAWAVRDLRSANGTRVNGVALEGTETRPLGYGDHIRIGSRTLLTVGEVMRYVENG